MTGQFQMIFSDIDGTLLDSRNQVPERTGQAIRDLERRGVPFILVSARMPDSMVTIQAQLGNRAPMVCYSGGLILDEAGRTIYSRTICLERALALKEMFDREFPQLCCNTYGYGTWAVDDRDDPWVRGEEEITGLTALAGTVKELFDGVDGVHKFLLMGEPEEISRAQSRIRELCPDLSLGASKPEYLEIMDGAVHKAHGLRVLCGHCGVPVEASVAFGDGENDISMLQAAGRGYAMANAPMSVRQSVSYLAPDNDHEGILTVLQELFEI